ncbi:flagellar basal body-associated FliL family protein [Desulforudis sp. 1088]|uniref:flagellar basal body-associated FliL family protein n=1 Tax=unclassified Candidatus Desulforudis TaxID=2635950 RepID=UPI003CE462C0
MPGSGEAQEPKAVPAPRRRLPVKLIALMLVLLIVGGGIAAAYYKSSPALQAKVGLKLPKKEEKYKLVELGTIVVNLADVQTARYLKIGLAISIPEKKAEEIHEKDVQIKDRIINILRRKTAAEILAVDKTDDLRKELLDQVNSELHGFKAKEIYIVEFLVQ